MSPHSAKSAGATRRARLTYARARSLPRRHVYCRKVQLPKLRVGWHDTCKERRHEQRCQPRCRRTRLQVAHIRLERRALRSLPHLRAARVRADVTSTTAQRCYGSAHLQRRASSVAQAKRILCPILSAADTPHTRRKTITSIGSPSAVPVPCASSAGASRPSLSPPRTVSKSRRCDDPFGAVRLALGPSCCTADPRTDAPNVRPVPSPPRT